MLNNRIIQELEVITKNLCVIFRILNSIINSSGQAIKKTIKSCIRFGGGVKTSFHETPLGCPGSDVCTFQNAVYNFLRAIGDIQRGLENNCFEHLFMLRELTLNCVLRHPLLACHVLLNKRKLSGMNLIAFVVCIFRKFILN